MSAAGFIGQIIMLSNQNVSTSLPEKSKQTGSMG